MKRPRPFRVAPVSRLRFEALEDRTVPTTIPEVEPNDTFALPQVVSSIPTGDILTTPANDWLTIQGSITGPSGGATNLDYYKFTLTQRAGVFFDIDAPGSHPEGGLQTGLRLFDGNNTQISFNDFGYDFEEFSVPETAILAPEWEDSALYADLQPGTYAIQVRAWNFRPGNYDLRILADATYASSPPVFNSNPTATDTLYMDYNGHSAAAGQERWNSQQAYTALPYDFSGNASEWSPGERLAIRNTWQALADDYSPFNINITTAAAPATMVAGQSLRMVITNSNGSIIGQPSSGLAGIAWLDVYGDDLHEWRTSFVFSGAMPNSLFQGDGGLSGDIVAKAHEIGATAAHEFGHNLNLRHYQAQASEGPGTVLPKAIMAWSNQGVDKTRWAKGTTYNQGQGSIFQDDMAVIANTFNTFGYRADDHAATTGTATALTAIGNTYTATGIIAQVTDADWFRVSAFGATTITVDVSDFSANLDVVLRLRDSTGTVVATANPANAIDATISQTLAAGTYYLDVQGTGLDGIAGQYSLRVDTTVLAPPALTGIETAALAYTENQSLAVTGTLAVADPDSANLQGATVTLSAGYAPGQDFLDFTNQGGISGSFSTGTLTLTGTATVAAYQAALRSVQYRNSSENPSTAARTVSFRVTDPDGNQSNIATRNIAVTSVNDAPVADNEAYATNEDTQLTIAPIDGVLIGDTDPEASTITAVLVDTVQHGTLSLASNGSFVYTPAANYNGTDTFTYRASDGNLTSNLATVTLIVNAVNDAPVADNEAYATNEDTPLTVAVPGVLDGDTDVEGSTLTAVLVGDVQHGTLTLNSNGSFVYTPAANYNGPDSFTYRANDGSANSNLATVTLTVNAVNDAPVADNDAYATNEDVPLTVAAPGVLDGDTDVEGTTLTAALVDNVQHGTLTLNSNGSFTYTPAANYNGPDSFTYRASDGSLTSNLATVTLTINAVNDPPVADNEAYSTNEDTQLTIVAPGVLDGDTDVEGSALTAVLVGDVQHGTLTLSANGSFVYTPAANYNGPDSFTYRANDGSAQSNLATVTLTVNAINDAPVADNDAYATNEDTQMTIAVPGVLDGDTDAEGATLTAALVDNVQHGTLTLNANGSFVYTPAANYNGPDSFTYRASDGSLTSNLATVTLTINAVNDPPVADNEAYSTNEDTPLTVAAPGVLDGDTDVEGSALTAVLVDNVQHGSLTLNANGSFVYTPAANYNGPDSFTYRANDGSANSNLATVTLTVNAIDDAPIADNDAYATNEDTQLTVAAPGVLDGDTDAEGATLTAALVDNVQHGALTLNANGSFTYTPAANYNGTDTFTYRASDGSLTSNLATVTLTINAVNDPPVADNEAYAVNEDGTLTVPAATGVLIGDTDVEGSTLTAALVDNVQHGTLSLASDGSFVYTPAANYNGPDSFTYRANDGSANSNLATVTITVNAVNDIPVADNDAYATNEDVPLTVPAATGVLNGDTDVDGDPLTAVLVDNVQHGALTLNADGSFVYTPVANYNGPDSFTYRANDGSANSNLATVTLTVNAVNDAPVADNDAYATNEDTQLTVAVPGVLDGDTDVEGSTLTAALVDDVQHGTLTLNANGSFVYTPAANYNGPDSFTYRANDGAANSNLATVTLTVNAVNDAPVADNDAHATNEDTPLTIAAPGVLDGDTDVEGATLTATLVGDVQHGTLTLNANGSFTYTPAANYNGTDTFTYRASDGSLTSNLATVTLTINAVNDAPVADNEAYSTNEDTQLTVAAPGVLDGDTDVEGSALTAVLVDNVQHGTLALNANGSFVYTPAANYNGSDSFTYRANDGSANSNLATVTLTINAVNDPPVADNDSYTTNENTQLTITAPGVLDGDTDVEGSTLTAALVDNVQHGTLTLNSNGSFTYTPEASFNGPDTFTYRANDGSANSNLATVTITVDSVNDPPVADNDAYTTNEDTQLVVPAATGVLDGDTDPEGATLTAVLADNVQHGTLVLNANGSFTYTPAANYNGPDSFTYRANDGSLNSNLATVTLTINAVNDAPVADNDAYSTNEDVPLTVAVPGVLDGDTDVEGSTLTAALVSDVQHGTLTLNANGSFVYTPAANYNGSDSFTYRASDGSLNSNLATVTLTINAVNDPPVADNEAYTTDEDTPLTVAVGTGVLVGDTDVEGATLTAALVDNVQHGSLTLNADGSFVYTPAANYNGSDSFTYRASDGSATSNLATVTLTINAVNDAPVADSDAYATNEDTPLTIVAPGVLDGDTDVEGAALTAALVDNVQHGTLTLNANGSFTYTPTANYNGTDTFTYRASDGSLTSNLATVTLTINAVNDPPVADDEAYSVAEDGTLNVPTGTGVLVGDTDIEGATLTAALVDTVQHGTLTLNADGSFVYTPAANYNGTDTFTYRASDGSATSNLATVTLTIDPVNDAPVADADAYTVNEDGSLSVPAGTGALDGDTDVEGSPLTAALVDTVQHGSLTFNTDGSFVYTPAANYHGPDTFTYRANDGSLNSNLATVTITVDPVNDVPVADDDAYATSEDLPLSIPAGTGVLNGDTDLDGDPLTAALVDDVQHGTLTLNANGSFTYTPAANYNGTDTFTYRAGDGTATSNLATVTLTIDPVNDAPVADNDAYTVAEGGTLTVPAATGVLDGDTDVEGATLTAALVSDVQHGTLTLNADGSFTYTPAGNYSGPDSFTYQASDGTATSNLATVTITVIPLNFPPVAQPDSYTVAEDGSLSVGAPGVLGNDTDPDGDPLTAVLVDDVQHGSLTLNADGSFTYTPAANYNGPDSFTYQADDGTVPSGVVTVSLTVTPVNDAPAAVGDGHTTPEDVPLVVGAPGVLGNDSDIDGDTLTAVPVAGPAHGTLTLNPDGSFTYTPATNYFGPDSFTYAATDGIATTTPVTVDLTVTAVNDAPTAGDDTAAVLLKKSVTISVLANDTDPEGNPFSIQSFTQPTKGTVRRSGNTFVYTSTGPLAGADSFTYTVVDSLGAAATATVQIAITDPVAPALTAVRARYGVAGLADLKSLGRIVLPWAGLTRFELGFSEDAIPTAAALTLTGPAGAVPLTLAPVPAGGAKTAVWSFAALTPGMYTLQVIAAEVRDVNGNPLPVNYTRTFGILPGDFDGNGLVDSRDLSGIKRKYQSNPALADRFADINGDGIVNVLDYNIAKAALGTHL
jgi:large repetitive protein